MKKQLYPLLFALLLQSCMATKAISPQNFEAIPIGCDVKGIEAQYGPPYEVKTLSEGKEYWYLQRIDIAPGVCDQINYFFYVVNGKIVDKRKEQIQSGVDINYR